MRIKTTRALAPAFGVLHLLCALIGSPAAAQIGPDGLAPVITAQPASGFGIVGTTAQMSVTATGTPPIFYQWQFKGANDILGATNDVYPLYLNSTNQTGRYRVVVSNAFGSVTSSFVTLYVREPLRFLTDQGAVGFPGGGSQVRLAGGWFPYAALVEFSSDLRAWSPLYTNFAAGAPFSVTDSNANGLPRRFYRASARLPLARFALAAEGQINLNGNDIGTDSFDSTDPVYSTVGGLYDPTKHKAGGDIATGAGLTNSVSVGNAKILGRVYTGLGGSVSIGAYGSIGDLAWAASGHTGAQAGFIRDNLDVHFQDAPNPPGGGVSMSGGGTVGGVSYDNILGNEVFEESSISLSGNNAILVSGINTVLYVRGDLMLSGNSRITLMPGARLNLYVGGSSSIGGNGIQNPGNALNFIYYGLTNNASVNLHANGVFTGVVYAPRADFVFGSGGTITNEFVGAVVSRNISINGHSNFHYDEALLKYGPLY